MPKPKHPDHQSWIDQYWKSQLKAAESRQTWLWGDSSLPELGFLLKLLRLGFGIVLFPIRFGFNVWRRQKRRAAFRSYLRGEDPQ